MNNIGTNLARQRERFIQQHGTSVLLSSGETLNALIKENDHELLRAITNDGDAPEKRPVVLVFAGSAWGTVLENMKVTIGTGTMARNFRLTPPLHPKWRQDVVTELAVVATGE